LGFSITISASIVFIALLISFLALSSSITSLITSTAKSIDVKASLSHQYQWSAIRVDNAKIINSTTLIFNVSNVGYVKIWDYEHCDLIVSYACNNSLENITYKVIYRLNYTTNKVPKAGEWALNAIFNDFRDPNIVNPNETAEILANLTYEVAYGELFTITFCTNYGFPYEYTFIATEGTS